MGQAHNHVAALAVMYWHCNGDMAKLLVLICIHIRDHWGDGNCLMSGQQRVISCTVWSEGSDTTSCEQKNVVPGMGGSGVGEGCVWMLVWPMAVRTVVVGVGGQWWWR